MAAVLSTRSSIQISFAALLKLCQPIMNSFHLSFSQVAGIVPFCHWAPVVTEMTSVPSAQA